MTFRLTHYWDYYKDKMTTDTVISNTRLKADLIINLTGGFFI